MQGISLSGLGFAAQYLFRPGAADITCETAENDTKKSSKHQKNFVFREYHTELVLITTACATVLIPCTFEFVPRPVRWFVGVTISIAGTAGISQLGHKLETIRQQSFTPKACL